MTLDDARACLQHWGALPDAEELLDHEVELVAVTHDGQSFYLLLWDEGEGSASFEDALRYRETVRGHIDRIRRANASWREFDALSEEGIPE